MKQTVVLFCYYLIVMLDVFFVVYCVMNLVKHNPLT